MENKFLILIIVDYHWNYRQEMLALFMNSSSIES